MCVPVANKDQKWIPDPMKFVSDDWQVTMWVLGIKDRSSASAVSAIHH